MTSDPGTAKAPLRIALHQTVGVIGDKRANIAALEAAVAGLARMGVALLVLPELWLTGYNAPELLADLAEPADGPSAQTISRLAAAHDIAIIYGYPELAADRLLYNSARAVGPRGQPLANYRKTHLFGPMERAVFWPGDALNSVFTLGDWRLGLAICYEIEFPEPIRALALQGADLIVVPTALTEVYGCVPRSMVPTRAVENQVFIAYCNHAGNENGLTYLGGSHICGPDGATIAAAGAAETMLVADLDYRLKAKIADLYPYMADRRPELYTSLIQRSVP